MEVSTRARNSRAEEVQERWGVARVDATNGPTLRYEASSGRSRAGKMVKCASKHAEISGGAGRGDNYNAASNTTIL